MFAARMVGIQEGFSAHIRKSVKARGFYRGDQITKIPARRICIIHGWDDPLARITIWGDFGLSYKEILQSCCWLVLTQEISLYEISNMKKCLWLLQGHFNDGQRPLGFLKEKEGFAWWGWFLEQFPEMVLI